MPSLRRGIGNMWSYSASVYRTCVYSDPNSEIGKEVKAPFLRTQKFESGGAEMFAADCYSAASDILPMLQVEMDPSASPS